MTESSGKGRILADKRIWIIDDEIPIDRWEHCDDLLLNRQAPMDRGTLLALVDSDQWDETPLKRLCWEVSHQAVEVLAFSHPAMAVQYLEQGAAVPDVVVFDLTYGQQITMTGAEEWTSPIKLLTRILKGCVTIVQVYTNADVDQAKNAVQALRAKYPTRLPDPIHKGDTSLEHLLTLLQENLQHSLSARMATRVRRSSASAVEKVLTHIDGLPLDIVIHQLTDRVDVPEDLQLVELLSIKVSEALESNEELAAEIERFLSGQGVNQARTEKAVSEIVAMLASSVREHVLDDRDLLGDIGFACRAAAEAGKLQADGETQQAIQDFFAFRLYHQPTDEVVRTGDIIEFETGSTDEESLPDLYVVITPPCDLARFWKNTRGVLTCVRMHPMTKDRGIYRHTTQYKHRKPSSISSITAKHNPLILPSITLSEDRRQDYVLFVYEIHSIELDGTSLWKPEDNTSKEDRFTLPLRYPELAELKRKCTRRCRISEPFLSGLLAELRNHLFRPGVPDFPEEEDARLVGLFS